MVNYNNGKIYKIEPICDYDEGDIYIGSTTKQYLSQRMTAHKKDYRSYQKGNHKKITSFILFDKYGIDNCNILLLELVNVETKDELHNREAHYIKNLKCVNKIIPKRTPKEYRQDNKESIIIKKKQYRQDNKVFINIKHKEYNDTHKEVAKQYYLRKKSILSETHICDCGSSYMYTHKARHFKTIKHCKYIDSLTTI